MLISESEIYKKEIEKIQKFLRETNNETVKSQVSTLFNSLVLSVKKIDIAHRDLVSAGRLASDINETRDELSVIRKKIFSIIDKN